jgi:putative oxidoreductase
MQLGRLLLRATVGEVFFVHGTQKLFGWFGGYGPDGTGSSSSRSGCAQGGGMRWRLALPRRPGAS